MKKDYSDIINMPHYESPDHPRMSKEARAAQFMPFAALTGYEEAIERTAEENEAEYDTHPGYIYP